MLLVASYLVGAAIATSTPAHAGLADRLKKKLADKATEKVDKGVDQGASDAETAATGKAPDATAADAAGAKPATADQGTVATVSTKFDFVPGDSVIFADDFTQDDLGEFPAHWKLAQGTYEVAEMQGERWLRCTSADGHVRMKVPPALPEFWTLEFDFYCEDPAGSIALTVTGLSEGGSSVWELMFPYSGSGLGFRSGSIMAITPLGGSVKGRHHVMLLARGKAIKAYLDRERVANVPEYDAANGAPTELDFRAWAVSPPMITNVRFAEGPRPAKDMLAAGKLVTYGIHFASGSDVVLADSAPVLRQVASYLQANAAVKLRITGHTDNVGAPASNLDLSKRRAASVAKVLATELGIAADRFETAGQGDTQAVASNAKAEGRAMNRRVEFVKL
jgi:outer membrane protein OmpA-like peptidoglycan-associated protein